MVNNKTGYIDIIEEEFGTALGSDGAAYRERVTIFIAHKDCNGNLIPSISTWVERAEAILSKVGGGATSIQVRGAWLGDKPTPLHEETTLVYSYAPPQLIANSVILFRDFLYSYGRETQQGEVVLSLENPDGNWFFRIPSTKYKI